MDDTERSEKQAELTQLRARVAELERQLGVEVSHWEAREFYLTYYATSGFFLGMLGAITSLLFNVIGSLMVGQHPMKLIQIYLTFPLGEKALALDSGLALTLGCCLYIGTGMLLGVPFYVLLVWFTRNSSFAQRLILGSILALSMWLVHFYVILNFIQEPLFGGNFIVKEIPWWIGAMTHLIYGWTLVLAYPLGLYTPYHRPTEKTA